MKTWCGLLALSLACSGKTASATFVGTVHGQSLHPTDAISSQATVMLSSATAPAAAVILSDASALCRKVTANQEPANARVLVLFLADATASGAFSAPAGIGTFNIFTVGSGSAPPHLAVASFGVNDGTCHAVAADAADAVAGTVTLTHNDGSSYTGTYELTFDSGDHVTGSFDTVACRGLATFLASDAQTCGG